MKLGAGYENPWSYLYNFLYKSKTCHKQRQSLRGKTQLALSTLTREIRN
jgi:hypothetical protein